MKQAGFTIIELLIATSVFSIVLIIVTTSIIGINDTFTKGQIQSQVQQNARTIVNDVAQDIQFNDAHQIDITAQSAGTSTDEFYYCMGNDVYLYTLNNKLTGTTFPNNVGLTRFSSTSCPASLPATTCPQVKSSCGASDIGSVQQLLSQDQRIGQFLVTNIPGTNAYTISITIGYGDSDLLQANPSAPSGTLYPTYNYALLSLPAPPTSITPTYSCMSGSDSDFCGVSTLTTTVEPRITY